MGIYTIYKFTNKKNGKSYIGKTNNLKRRINEHKNSSDDGDEYFYRAIRKYGFNNFDFDILFQSTSKLISEKEFTNTFEPLLIKEHKSHHSENGYNMTWGGNGIDSDSARQIALKRIEQGNHNLTKRPDGSSVTADKVKNGTHPWSKRPDGSSVTADKVKNGTHPFMKDGEGVSLAQKRVAAGTHNLTESVTCYDTNGKCHQISKEVYYSQSGPMDTWKWVHNQSIEGRKRSNRTINVGIPCVNKEGKIKLISKDIYYSQKGNSKNWEWVHNRSKEGKIRLHSI